jgi:hypothetical protein
MQCKNCQTPPIIQEMGKLNGNNFKANENRLSRFLDSSEFMIEDKIWREYIKMLLSLLIERSYIKENSNICINVDFTSKTDEFLILSASIQFKGRSLPLYFSMRRYPVKAGMIDQKLMEKAFLLELSRLLPHEKYKYTIVADRGFANTRFMSFCREYKFNYVIRTDPKWNIEMLDWKGNMKDIQIDNKDIGNIKLKCGKFETRLIMSENEEKKSWCIFTDLPNQAFEEILREYKNRFQCEKMFQDEKSSGFEIEKSKIEKYSRFKRLLFCIYVAQALMMFLGDWINGEAEEIRKKYHLHISLISVFSKLQNVY